MAPAAAVSTVHVGSSTGGTSPFALRLLFFGKRRVKQRNARSPHPPPHQQYIALVAVSHASGARRANASTQSSAQLCRVTPGASSHQTVALFRKPPS
jgi:hypothetical protein